MKLFSSNNKAAMPSLSRQEALQCIPVIHQSIRSSTAADGNVLLEYPLPLRPLFQALLQRFQKDYSQPTKKLELDEMGTMVWMMIDGKTSVKTMVNEFTRLQGITLEEAEKSVTSFLAELGKRGIIALI